MAHHRSNIYSVHRNQNSDEMKAAGRFYFEVDSSLNGLLFVRDGESFSVGDRTPLPSGTPVCFSLTVFSVKNV